MKEYQAWQQTNLKSSILFRLAVDEKDKNEINSNIWLGVTKKQSTTLMTFTGYYENSTAVTRQFHHHL